MYAGIDIYLRGLGALDDGDAGVGRHALEVTGGALALLDLAASLLALVVIALVRLETYSQYIGEQDERDRRTRTQKVSQSSQPSVTVKQSRPSSHGFMQTALASVTSPALKEYPLLDDLKETHSSRISSLAELTSAKKGSRSMISVRVQPLFSITC